MKTFLMKVLIRNIEWNPVIENFESLYKYFFKK